MRSEQPSVAMLYFHPWEFDENQPQLPLGRMARWRTYVGIRRTTRRLQSLLGDYPFMRAIDAVQSLRKSGVELARYELGGESGQAVPTLKQGARL